MPRYVPTSIPPHAKTVCRRPTETCPTCGEASWKYADGSIFCLDHGGFKPEPEPRDVDNSRFINPFDLPEELREADGAEPSQFVTDWYMHRKD